MIDEPWIPLFGLACVGLGAASGAALRLRLRARHALGPILNQGGRNGVARVLAFAILMAAAAWWWAVESSSIVGSIVGSLAVVSAAFAVWMRPATREEACGGEGVLSGWTVRSFAELEEWRLVGEHLRFRVGERWIAVSLPEEHHARVAGRLKALAPERESPFK